jgi:hypothetical protein
MSYNYDRIEALFDPPIIHALAPDPKPVEKTSLPTPREPLKVKIITIAYAPTFRLIN